MKRKEWKKKTTHFDIIATDQHNWKLFHFNVDESYSLHESGGTQYPFSIQIDSHFICCYFQLFLRFCFSHIRSFNHINGFCLYTALPNGFLEKFFFFLFRIRNCQIKKLNWNKKEKNEEVSIPGPLSKSNLLVCNLLLRPFADDENLTFDA